MDGRPAGWALLLVIQSQSDVASATTAQRDTLILTSDAAVAGLQVRVCAPSLDTVETSCCH